MNLVNEKWIPVIRIDGVPDHASLMEVFTKGENYADLSVRPHERVALMRLLICIAQAALDGPKDKNEWAEASKKLYKAAEVYLNEWQGSFNLFDPKKPFLQIAELKLIPKKTKEEAGETKKGKTSRKKPKQEDVEAKSGLTPLSKMDFRLATGNNSTIFDHEAVSENERIFHSKQIALMLLTFQCFSPGGGLPITQWESVRTKQVGNPDSLCVTGGMYHLFLRGATLNQTICLNLLTKDVVRQHYGVMNTNDSWGKPVWEMFPSAPDDENNIGNATNTYLGRLTPICRWIKIEADCKNIYCGKGFDYPVLERKMKRDRKTQVIKSTWPAEPTASVKVITKKDNSQERVLLGAKPDKAIWRELAALMMKRTDDGIGGPLVFQNNLFGINFDIHVCALIRNQASIEETVESVFNVSSNLFTDSGRLIYEKEIEQTENLATKLGWAVETYRQNIDKNWEARCDSAKNKFALKNLLYSTATRSYWTTVEKYRHLLMAHIDAIGTTEEKVESTQKTWRSAVHKAAREAYIAACGQETSRQIRAFALGWKKLFAEPKDKNEEHEDGGEE